MHGMKNLKPDIRSLWATKIVHEYEQKMKPMHYCGVLV